MTATRRAPIALAAVLSLALAMRSSNPVLQVASPLMRAASETCRANVGLATVDRNEMVYLESFRYNRRRVLRTVVSGQRVPIELTSLGRAYLAAAPEENRKDIHGNARDAEALLGPLRCQAVWRKKSTRR